MNTGSATGGAATIRACTAADVELLAALEPAGKNYARSTFRRQERGECVLLVAWLGSTPVGSGELEWGAVPELKNLRVAERWRGRRIGTALIRAAEQQSAPVEAMEIGVGQDNPGARRLYERLGYAPTGRSETFSYHYIDDQGVRQAATEAVDYLRKRLGGASPLI